MASLWFDHLESWFDSGKIASNFSCQSFPFSDSMLCFRSSFKHLSVTTHRRTNKKFQIFGQPCCLCFVTKGQWIDLLARNGYELQDLLSVTSFKKKWKLFESFNPVEICWNFNQVTFSGHRSAISLYRLLRRHHRLPRRALGHANGTCSSSKKKRKEHGMAAKMRMYPWANRSTVSKNVTKIIMFIMILNWFECNHFMFKMCCCWK